MINEQTIRRWWDILKGDSPVEIRIFSGNTTFSGYFTDVEKAIPQLRGFDGGAIYATLNPCVDACMSKVQGDQIIKIGKNPTTSGNDIERREWILIDFDPRRPAGTNSTDEEKAHAERMMREVFKYLRQVGFQSPVVADSANGYHLYYRIDLENTPESTTLVSTFLKTLDAFFSDNAADVDIQVFDPNRIAKIIGTQSAKGRNTKERPQRLSRFIYIPDEIKITPKAFIEKVAREYPEAPVPDRSNNYSNEKFNIDGFIRKYGIPVLRRVPFRDGEKIILKECPFDHNHKDAAIFRFNNGAMAFKCFHNSCAQYHWKDFRLHFDPNAYDRKDYNEFRNSHRYDRNAPKIEIKPENEQTGKKWLNPSSIKWVDPSSFPFVPTGIISLDRVMLGLTLGDVTILSGLAGSGKTSLIDFIILNSVNKGYKAAVWSGELQDFRFMSWLDQMAAGKTNVVQQQGYENIYYAPKRISEKVNSWLDDKFWLYNNNYGNRWSQLYDDIKKAIKEFSPHLIVVDNLTALDLDSAGDDSNGRQKSFINELKDLAKASMVHILLVCHPRKEQSFHMLRMESIAGSSDLVNLCDNVVIVHRSGNDLRKRMMEFFPEEMADEYCQYDSVLEIAKNRSHGAAGKMMGLYFEKETRRFQNSLDENIVYGWDESTPRMYIDNFNIQPNVEEFDDLPE